MIALTVTFFVVLFCGCNAALPAVGRCSFIEYYCDATKCNTAFIKELQKDPSADCGIKYLSLTSCVKKTLTYCVGQFLSESLIDGIIRQNFKKDALCMEGNLNVPASKPGVTLPCSIDFGRKGVNCSKTFHAKFQANRSDSSLCSEYAKAKKCYKDLIASDCNFSALDQEVLDLTFNDYNPYCDDNRDPGASGHDQCYGVSTLTPPISSTDSSTTSGSTAPQTDPPFDPQTDPPFDPQTDPPFDPKGFLRSTAISTGGWINLTALFICVLLMRFY